jgi:hypothetical protein
MQHAMRTILLAQLAKPEGKNSTARSTALPVKAEPELERK